jgi:RNA-directed DNA polymerase
LPAPEVSAQEIVALRKKLNMSQPVFARHIRASPDTLKVCAPSKFQNPKASKAVGYSLRRGSFDPAGTAATAHADLYSYYSYSFRPGRGARQTIETACAHVATGHRWCVELDLDLEKFFDRVSHDVLMVYVRRQIEARQVLKLIRRYLGVGVMSGGIVSRRHR